MTECLVSRAKERFSIFFKGLTCLVMLCFLPSHRGLAASPESTLQKYRSEVFSGVSGPRFEVLQNSDPQSFAASMELPWWAELLNSIFTVSPLNWSGDFEECVAARTFDDCESILQTGPKSQFLNGLLGISLDWNATNHPYAQVVRIQLENGIQLKGLLGLKPDRQKRPLVVLRPGIFSAGSEIYGERFLWYMLFEQSEFHILVLESVSSVDFHRHNKTPVSPGVAEGLQNLEVLKLLQSPDEPVSKLVSEIHLVGISLGAASVLHTARRASLSQLKSVTALCPIVDLEASLQAQSQKNFTRWISNYWAAHRLQALLPRIERKTGSLVNDYFDFMKQGHPWKVSDYVGNYLVPTTVIVSEKDPLLPTAFNADLLQTVKAPHYRFKKLEESYHCSMWVPYDWKWVSTLLQKNILDQSEAKQYRDLEFAWPTKLSRGVPFLQSVNFFPEKVELVVGTTNFWKVPTQQKVSLLWPELQLEARWTTWPAAKRQWELYLKHNLVFKIEKAQLKATLRVIDLKNEL